MGATKLETSPKGTVFVIDDDEDMLALLNLKIKGMGFNVVTEKNSQAALKYLQENSTSIDLILIDLNMPNLNGIEFVQIMKKKAELKFIPAIMLTASENEDDIKKGISVGVFYFANKKMSKSLLEPIILSAYKESQRHKTISDEIKKHHTSFILMNEATFSIKTLDEGENLAYFLANCFPDPSTVASGLYELFTNSIEHGNLGIGFEKKASLIKNNTWKNYINERLKLPEYRNKSVYVHFLRQENGCYVRIRDEGKGFPWSDYLHLNPSRANSSHGRGIAHAFNICFDEMNYNDAGNEVIVFIDNDAEIDW